MKISEEIIQKIKVENDIVDIISETVRLRKAGRNYLGICPFHKEKTPSFSVSSEKQIYKCFGCGEAGNVFTFVMKNRNMSFFEAAKYLADRANIVLDYNDEKSKAIEDKKEKLYKLNVEAAKYFYSNLSKDKTAQNYFFSRGIRVETIKKFGLGFAKDDWHGILRWLRGKGYTELDLLDAGLVIKSEKGNLYDRFRNIVIFPVFDSRGKVIGFGGRVLDDSKPKYLNSPETMLFQKGTNLYGLNFALRNFKSRVFIIVEGYMDCISLHQYGITNVVASLGTALTVQQAKLLKRYADKVIISYDADIAGQSATMRGIDILRNVGFDVRILTVPSGKDPDEFIRANGKDAFIKLAENALPLIDYRIKKAGEGINFKDEVQLIKYVKSVTSILTNLNPVEKDVYIKKISHETGVKEQAIYDTLNEEIGKNSNNDNNLNTSTNFGQKLYVEPAYIKAERLLLKLMSLKNEMYDFIISNISSDTFIMNGHKKIFELLMEYNNQDIMQLDNFIEYRCDDIESSKEWIIIKNIELMQEDYENINLVDDYINEIKRYKLEETKKEIMIKIKECENKGLLEESMKYAQRLMEIKREEEKA